MNVFEDLAVEVIEDLEIRGEFSRENKTDEEMQELITFLANSLEIVAERQIKNEH